MAHTGHLSRGADEIASNGKEKVEGKNTMNTFSASPLPMSFAFLETYQGNCDTYQELLSRVESVYEGP